MREIPLQAGAQDLVGGGLDVVLDPLELEAPRRGVEHREARAVVVVARLPDGAENREPAPAGQQLYGKAGCRRE